MKPSPAGGNAPNRPIGQVKIPAFVNTSAAPQPKHGGVARDFSKPAPPPVAASARQPYQPDLPSGISVAQRAAQAQRATADSEMHNVRAARLEQERQERLREQEKQESAPQDDYAEDTSAVAAATARAEEQRHAKEQAEERSRVKEQAEERARVKEQAEERARAKRAEDEERAHARKAQEEERHRKEREAKQAAAAKRSTIADIEDLDNFERELLNVIRVLLFILSLL